MTIQRMSDEHNIKFLEGVQDDAPAKKADVTPDKTIQQVAEEQKARKLNNKDNGLMTNSTIFSARTGSIRDEGGPSKYIKSESSNTIWENDKTAKVEMDNKEKTIKEKEVIATNKRDKENKRMSDLAEAISQTEQRKASSVSPLNNFEGSNYKVPTKNISMFDTFDFERLQEKTAGEQVSEDTAKRASQKDDSWKNNGKSLSSKDISKKLFDNFFSS